MKYIKKILALALALSMALALAVPAFAENQKITITIDGVATELPLPDRPKSEGADISKHTFGAYQIFSAQYATNSKDLVGIHWGSSVDAGSFLAALKADATLKNDFKNIAYDAGKGPADYKDAGIDPVAYAVAKAVSGYGGASGTSYGSEKALAFARVAYEQVHSKTPVAQKSGSGDAPVLAPGYYLVVDLSGDANAANDVRNLAVLAMDKDAPFNPKVKADVPEMDKQVLEINDSKSKGAENNYKWSDAADYDLGDDVAFVLTGTLPTNYEEYETYKYVFHDTLSAGLTLDTDSIRVYVNGTDKTTFFTKEFVTSENKKYLQTGDSFAVGIDDLNVIGGITSNTVIQVVYTAKLDGSENAQYEQNEAHLQFSNDPNHKGNGTGTPPPTGNTPKETVTVFTFTLKVDKVREAEGNETGPQPLKDAGFTLYKKYVTAPLDENGNSVTTDIEGYYPVGDELKGEDMTTFEFTGLDAGDYLLRETTVPKGYNPAEDIYFTIVSQLDDKDPTKTTVSVENIHNVHDGKEEPIVGLDGKPSVEIKQTSFGVLQTSILNLKGVRLPGTGGIGTTIFYVVGGLLLVGASVVLIARKRMKHID